MLKPVTKAFEAIAEENYNDYTDQFFDFSTDYKTSVLYYFDFTSANNEYYNGTSKSLKKYFGESCKIKDIEVVNRVKFDVTELYNLSKEVSEGKKSLSAITDVNKLDVNVVLSTDQGMK